MRIFTWHMAQRFFRPFLLGLAIFSLLIFLGDMIDKMSYLAKSKAPFGVILQYLWLEVPYWAVRVVPMATLLATLIAITGFVQSGEWLAVQASGFETKSFWKPVLWCALVVTALSFAAQETILPACYQRARRLWRDRIHPEWEWDKYFDIALLGGPGRFISAKLFLPKEGRMERPMLERVGPKGVESQLDARSALWDGRSGRWVFHEGVERTFTDGRVAETPFSTKPSDLDIPPRHLIPRTTNPDEMSLREMRGYAERLSQLGIPRREFEVAAHAKVAYPFVNFVICALGIPIALRLRRSAKTISFVVALVCSFLYLWLIEVGRALGTGGVLPPAVAAWAPNLVCAGIAAGLMRKVDI